MFWHGAHITDSIKIFESLKEKKFSVKYKDIMLSTTTLLERILQNYIITKYVENRRHINDGRICAFLMYAGNTS